MSDRLVALPVPQTTSTRSPLSLLALVRHVLRMWEAAQTRRVLGELDPRLLKDIGISRSEAEAEAMRAPWDLGPRRYWP